MIPIANPDIGDREIENIIEVLESGMLADGPKVRAFEDAFASYCGVNHGVATSNGTTALHTALKALDIGEGDYVITTPFSFIASANSIRLAGATPVFADINPKTFNLDPDAVEDLIANDPDRYDAILVVHLYGLPADMSRFVEIAEKYDVDLIEDAAQAHGASIDGQPVGSFGDVGCFSFYPTKNMTTGEGGMITTDNETVAEKAASFANHGRVSGDRSYDHGSVGHNFRMTSIAAELGRVQLERLPDFVSSRQENAQYLSYALKDSAVTVPTVPPDREHSYHQYTIRSESRDALKSSLNENDIGAGIYYPRIIPDEGAYEGVDASLPEARLAAQEVLSLPIHPKLEIDELDYIAEVISTHAS